MLKEILTQVALVCFGDKERLALAFLLCASPFLITTALVIISYSIGFKNGIKVNRHKNKNNNIADDMQYHQKTETISAYENEKANEEKRRLQFAQRKSIGREFELQVANELAEQFKDRITANKTRILHTINQPGFFDAEIDVLLIDTSGIYLIECKYWRGLIVGDVNWDYWIQIGCDFINGLPSIKEEHELFAKVFYSPVTQVSKQAFKLQKFITERAGFSRNVYKRMSVMQSSAHLEFLHKDYNGFYKNFTWFGTQDLLCDKIRDYQKQDDFVLTSEQVNDIYNAVRCLAVEEIGCSYK